MSVIHEGVANAWPFLHRATALERIALEMGLVRRKTNDPGKRRYHGDVL